MSFIVRKVPILMCLCVIFLFVQCRTMNTLQSHHTNENQDEKFQYYDREHKVAYWVENNDTEIHLKLGFYKQSNIEKVLSGGLSVYFDVKGKKKKNVLLNYPLRNERRRIPPQRENVQRNEPQKMASAVFVYFDKAKRFDVNESNNDIAIKLYSEKKGELLYDLVIPVRLIRPNGLDDLSKLSIGVVSGAINRPQGRPENAENRQDGGMNGPRGQGGGGRGMGGPGMEGQGMRGPENGGQRGPGMENQAGMSSPIDFWFKVDLFGIDE